MCYNNCFTTYRAVMDLLDTQNLHLQYSLFRFIHSFYPTAHQQPCLPGGVSGRCGWDGTRQRWQGGRLTQLQSHDGGPIQRPPGAGSGYSSSHSPDKRPLCKGEERRGWQRVRRRQQRSKNQTYYLSLLLESSSCSIREKTAADSHQPLITTHY